MTETKKVLVADDEPTIRRLVSRTLTGKGFEVVEAADGEEALMKVTTDKPDVVILDVMMPKLDGWEVRDAMRRDPNLKEIPIIILSAVGEFEDQLRGLESGAEDYITKPFAPEELVEAVTSILNPSRKGEHDRERLQRKARLRTIVDIMHRKRD